MNPPPNASAACQASNPSFIPPGFVPFLADGDDRAYDSDSESESCTGDSVCDVPGLRRMGRTVSVDRVPHPVERLMALSAVQMVRSQSDQTRLVSDNGTDTDNWEESTPELRRRLRAKWHQQLQKGDLELLKRLDLHTPVGPVGLRPAAGPLLPLSSFAAVAAGPRESERFEHNGRLLVHRSTQTWLDDLGSPPQQESSVTTLTADSRWAPSDERGAISEPELVRQRVDSADDADAAVAAARLARASAVAERSQSFHVTSTPGRSRPVPDGIFIDGVASARLFDLSSPLGSAHVFAELESPPALACCADDVGPHANSSDDELRLLLATADRQVRVSR
eukprot:TRINITY_DN9118_c0_g1_i1.p2 TRINITY_DN9118_c0_g1~~TRINITY_DN9118_c0_g1_i1.p2  ORF type:complete len:337 (-),score=92.42 TRINITY_DN9118_c0_g1_i1:149-1159(-)